MGRVGPSAYRGQKDRKSLFQRLVSALTPPSASYYDRTRLQVLLARLPASAKVLNVGSGSEDFGRRVINLDIEPFATATVVGDACQMPFMRGAFDMVILKAVLEHIADHESALAEVKRVTKASGVVYVEMPFLQSYHPSPGDYRRYTLSGLELVFKDYQKIECGVCVGPSASLAGLLCEYAALIMDVRYLRGMAYFTVGWLVVPFRLVDRFLIKKPRAAATASSLYFIGRNP